MWGEASPRSQPFRRRIKDFSDDFSDDSSDVFNDDSSDVFNDDSSDDAASFSLRTLARAVHPQNQPLVGNLMSSRSASRILPMKGNEYERARGNADPHTPPAQRSR